MTTPLLPRQTLSNDPEFVNENGREVPFWWTRVCSGLYLLTRAMADSFLDRPNYQNIGILWDILPPSGVYDDWILACEAEDKEGPAASEISPSKSIFSHHGQQETNRLQWLLNRETRMRYDPNYQNPAVYYNEYPQGAQYGMHSMPPPMYDPNSQMPPTYQPPMGGSKVDPSQWRTQPTRRPAEGSDSSPEYEAPPGPPPAAAMRPTNTGASTTSNNPYRL